VHHEVSKANVQYKLTQDRRYLFSATLGRTVCRTLVLTDAP
jgi:hypothetical protein